jgi:cysteine sulfinate desulfinase/cysteine desulfurase-like protein
MMTTTTDELIYLDNNATTQLDPVVIEEMLPFLTEQHNPSASYRFAAKHEKLSILRARLATLLVKLRKLCSRVADGIEQCRDQFGSAI